MSLTLPIEDLCRLQVSARISPKGNPVIYLYLKSCSQETSALSPVSPTGINISFQRSVAEDGSEFKLHFTTSFPPETSTAMGQKDPMVIESVANGASEQESYFVNSVPSVLSPPEPRSSILPATHDHETSATSVSSCALDTTSPSGSAWLSAVDSSNNSNIENEGNLNISQESSGSISEYPPPSEDNYYTSESTAALASRAGEFDFFDAQVRDRERERDAASSDMSMFLPDIANSFASGPPISAPVISNNFTSSLSTNDIETLLSICTFSNEVNPHKEADQAESSLHPASLNDVNIPSTVPISGALPPPPPFDLSAHPSDLITRKQRLPCLEPTCTRRFMSEYTRRVHMNTHLPKRAFVCTQGCTEEFSRQHDRFRHEVIKHGRKSEWSCETCLGFFSSAKSLANHKCTKASRKRWKAGVDSTHGVSSSMTG